MHYVYVLRSEKDKHLYIGSTHNLQQRLKAHNSGKVRSTKGRRPLALIYSEIYETKTEALKQELYYKSGHGKRVLNTKLRGSNF